MSIPTFVINLANRTDRLEFALAEAKSVGQTPRVISAVPAASIDPDEVAITRQSAGRIACWRSHVASWEAASGEKSAYSLILEDDVRWLRNPSDLLARIADLPDDRFDILQLGSLQRGPRAVPLRARMAHKLSKTVRAARKVHPRAANVERWMVDYSQLIARELSFVESAERLQEETIWGSFGSGTHAYVVNRNVIPKLTLYNDPVFLAADDALSVLAHQGNFRIGELQEGMATQAPFPSDLR